MLLYSPPIMGFVYNPFQDFHAYTPLIVNLQARLSHLKGFRRYFDFSFSTYEGNRYKQSVNCVCVCVFFWFFWGGAYSPLFTGFTCILQYSQFLQLSVHQTAIPLDISLIAWCPHKQWCCGFPQDVLLLKDSFSVKERSREPSLSAKERLREPSLSVKARLVFRFFREPSRSMNDWCSDFPSLYMCLIW